MSEPVLRVVHGRPTDEELAALVAVLLARAATAGDSSTPRGLWRDRTALLRTPLVAGRGAWRASALPS